MPVRILYLIRETFVAVLPKSQLKKYNDFERQKLKKIHEQLLREETTPDIHQIIKKILADITEVVEQHRELALQQGKTFDIDQLGLES